MQPLSLDQVNRWVLCKQHLADHATSRDIHQIVEDVGGLHATAPIAPYLSLFNRCGAFQRQQLEHELYGHDAKGAGPRLARLRCIRKTIHVLTAEMMPIYHSATCDTVTSVTWRYMQNRGVSRQAYAELSGKILGLLQDREMEVRALKEALGSDLDVSAVVNLMCDEGLLLRWRPAKTWRSRVQSYARFDNVFPSVDLHSIDQQEATARLVSTYLRALGPATEADVAWWTGLGKTRIRSALQELADRTARIQVTGLADELILFRSEIEWLQHTGPAGEPSVRLLPYLDPYLMGYTDRARYLDPRHRELVFDRSGNGTSAVLVDGRVAGVWDYQEREGPLLKIHYFQTLDPVLKERIRAKAVVMGTFLAGSPLQVGECPAMVPLTQRTAGSFMSPLKGQTSEI